MEKIIKTFYLLASSNITFLGLHNIIHCWGSLSIVVDTSEVLGTLLLMLCMKWMTCSSNIFLDQMIIFLKIIRITKHYRSLGQNLSHRRIEERSEMIYSWRFMRMMTLKSHLGFCWLIVFLSLLFWNWTLSKFLTKLWSK